MVLLIFKTARTRISALALGVALLTADTSARAGLTLTPTTSPEAKAIAYTSSTTVLFSLPFSQTVSAGPVGGNSSVGDFLVSDNLIRIDFNLSRQKIDFSQAVVQLSFSFEVSEEVAYDISALMNVNVPAGMSDRTMWFISLDEVPTVGPSTNLFFSNVDTGLVGPSSNIVDVGNFGFGGSTTGTLTPGFEYLLAVRPRVTWFAPVVDNASVVTADGFFDMTLTPIPEPGTAALLALGGLAVLRAKRRIRL